MIIIILFLNLINERIFRPYLHTLGPTILKENAPMGGACKCNYLDFLGNYCRPTNQPTDMDEVLQGICAFDNR